MTAQRDTFVAVGAVLERAPDLDRATALLTTYLLEPSPENESALARAGVNPLHIREFTSLLPSGSVDRQQLCALARAWALGRLSTATPGTWQPVVTSKDIDPPGIDRLTAETMVALIVGARTALRIFSPFIDARGLNVLSVALSAATKRNVMVRIGYVPRGDRDRAIESLVGEIQRAGDPTRLTTVAITGDRSYPHLKVIAADGDKAYIGSANLTWPALTSNAEVGALVTGEAVAVLERWFDSLLAPLPTDVQAV